MHYCFLNRTQEIQLNVHMLLHQRQMSRCIKNETDLRPDTSMYKCNVIILPGIQYTCGISVC